MPLPGRGELPDEVTRTGLDSDTLGRQQDYQATRAARYGRASATSGVRSRPKIEPLINESELMTTYLTLAGMLLLVVSPVLIPVTLTVVRFASDRFGHNLNRRETITAGPLPGTVSMFSKLPGVHPAPSPA